MHVDGFTHRDGRWWYDAPLPHRWHRCRAWTVGPLDAYGLVVVQRCACGGIRERDDRIWLERNSRRSDPIRGGTDVP